MQKLLSTPRSFRQRWHGVAKGIICMVFLLVEILVINVIQMFSIVFLPCHYPTFFRINRGLAQLFWGSAVWVQKIYWGFSFRFTGDEIPVAENALIIANHQEITDIPVLLVLADQKDRMGDFKWFVKDVVKFIPGVGWGMLFLNCIFVKRSWDKDESHIKQTFSRLLDKGTPFWVVSFVEGTRITPTKLRKSQEFASKNGLYQPQCTLVPRSRGFVATVHGLKEALDAVYDISIHYPRGIPSLWQYACGYAPEIEIHIQRTAIQDLPEHEGDLKTWLESRFKEKDHWLTDRARLQP